MNENAEILTKVGSHIVKIVGVIDAFVFLYNLNIIIFWLFLIGSVLITVLLLVKKNEESETLFIFSTLISVFLGAIGFAFSAVLISLFGPLWIISLIISLITTVILVYLHEKEAEEATLKIAVCGCILGIIVLITIPNLYNAIILNI